MVNRKAIRPALFTDTDRVLSNFARVLVNEVLDEAEAVARDAGADVKRMPKYLQITESRMADHGVIDLKPFFARSSKKRYNKKGEWYMYIPISMKTRDMSRRLYDNLRSIPTQGKQTTVPMDYLYDRRKTSPAVDKLNYTPKSKNVTIIPEKWGKGTRNKYVAFRTVNANSPANSWIINRNKVNNNDMSATMIANIDRLIKWKISNLGG